MTSAQPPGSSPELQQPQDLEEAGGGALGVKWGGCVGAKVGLGMTKPPLLLPEPHCGQRSAQGLRETPDPTQ